MNGRGLLFGLIGSLALNLFLVGMGAGAWVLAPRLMQPVPAASQGQGRPAPLWASARALSPEYRPALNAVLRAAAADSIAGVREARTIRRRAYDAMASDQFDAVAVNADLDRARALELAARARLERDIVTYSATLPREERTRLAKAMRAILDRATNARFRRRLDAGQPGGDPVQPAPARAGD